MEDIRTLLSVSTERPSEHRGCSSMSGSGPEFTGVILSRGEWRNGEGGCDSDSASGSPDVSYRTGGTTVTERSTVTPSGLSYLTDCSLNSVSAAPDT